MSQSAPKSQDLVRDESGSIRSPVRLALIGLALGVAFEVLLDRQPLGISFLLWMILGLLALFSSSRRENSLPARATLVLVLPIVFFAAMVAYRLEPLTTLLNLACVLGLTAWLLRAYRRGDLADYGWLDLSLLAFTVPVEILIRPWGPLSSATRAVVGEKISRSRASGVLRGLLLALPVVVLFAAFLAAADLVFADYVEEVVRWLNLENLLDWAGRAATALFVGIACIGALVAALRPVALARRLGIDRVSVPPFLGVSEAWIVLGAVDLLFATFVAIQFTYLFGGETSIVRAGYTYSEYARRGFGELLAVAALALGLILFLGALSRRRSRAERAGFLGLSATLVGLVGVLLASALTRLMLYEQAYGFTRLRTYTHAAIVWLGFLFAAFLVLLFWDRLRWFGLAIVVAGVGMAATFDGMGVDGFIVRQNGARLAGGAEIDLGYLMGLSDDAIPDLVTLARRESELREELLPRLACWHERLEGHPSLTRWTSYHVARQRAWQALESIREDLAPHLVRHPYPDPSTWQVVVDGTVVSCFE